MYRFLLFLCLITSSSATFAETITTIIPYNNPQNNYYNRRALSYQQPYRYRQEYQLSREDLSALEKYALNRVYSRDAEILRLERLEELAFGSTQSGNLRTRYKNVENAILSRPQNNYKRTLLNTIGNYFAGQTTGFTPSLYNNSYNQNFYPGYNINRTDQYYGGMFGNSAFRAIDNSFGTGSGVRIMY